MHHSQTFALKDARVKPATAPALALAVIAALSLSGCDKPKQQPAAAKTESALDAKPGISLSAGRLVLPAVTGNPGAAYFQINNSAGASTVVAAIAIDGAGKTEVHQTIGDAMTKVDQVEIAPSTSISFEPGKLHVMVFDILPRLKAGGTTELTVTFADGDKVSAPMKVEAPGGSDMEGMAH